MSANGPQVMKYDIISGTHHDHCQQCDATSGKDGQQLKKCGGCGVLLFCSKECQRKAWPSHK